MKFNMNLLVDYIIERAKEASTWRAIIMLLTGVTGITFSDTTVTQIVSTGVALSGLLGSVLPDKIKMKE